ncbi:hypothetical protein [Streptomyces sp. YU58]|uniref:hypothetical protein n=1 Tax=Streptomyces sp. SX92 TaxID=3158972 RepID=UPI0027BA4490|nr:hypothetical protein [Streptomyces coralus]WLW52620.1 hypothetical protein QU709_15045 [Streptomyces coralus]
MRFQVGAVLRVPLLSAEPAFGLMLSVRPYMAFYVGDEAAYQAEMRTGFTVSPLFVVAVHNSAYSSGQWGNVLYRVVPKMLPEIPVFFRQNIMNAADCEIVDSGGGVRKASPDECISLERSAVWSAEHVEARLRDHFAGRPNAFVESMKVKF